MHKENSITFYNKLNNGQTKYQNDVPWNVIPHNPYTPKTPAEITNITKNRVYVFAKEHPLVVLTLEQMNKIVTLLWEIIRKKDQNDECNLEEMDILEFRSTKDFMIIDCPNQKMVNSIIATISYGQLCKMFEEIRLKAVKATLMPVEFFYNPASSASIISTTHLDITATKPTVKDLWQQYREALQDLRVDIKINGLNQDDAYKEFSSILNFLKSEILSTVQSDFSPRFSETKITNDVLEITCHDNQTYKWLLNQLQIILTPSHKHGIKIERNPIAFLTETKVTLLIPGLIEDRNTVLTKIRTQNPELKTTNWNLYRSDYLEIGHKIYLRIDPESAYFISGQGGWIFYELGKLKMELGSKIPKGCKTPLTSIVMNKSK